VRVAEAEVEDEQDVTDACNCAASLYCDTAAESGVSDGDTQLRLASSTISLHVRRSHSQLCEHLSHDKAELHLLSTGVA